MSPFLSFVRRLRPVDLLLPIGSALVSAGLQNLSKRETVQRGRLDELAALAADHLEALAAAGIEVPAELAVDEPHPLDPVVAWMPAAAAEPVQDAPKPFPAWKWAALAVIGVVMVKRGPIVNYVLDQFGGYGEPEVDPARPGTFEVDLPFPPAPADYRAIGDEPLDDMCMKSDCGLLRHPSSVDHVFRAGADPSGTAMVDDASVTRATPSDECGWPNCGYMPPVDLPAEDQVLALAVHRNQCVYRPAGAHVPGV